MKRYVAILVLLGTTYEIQLLDSAHIKEPTGAHCGGIYPRAENNPNTPEYRHIDKGSPPRVNAARPPGQWQTMDIIFQSPRFDKNGKKTALVAAAAPKPNFVLIVADDLGYGDVSYQGGGVPTPNIDAIAQGGTIFTDGYVTCPVCAPSRAGMLTGRYQQSFGFWDNIGPFRRNQDVQPGIPVDLPILSERLKTLGYTCGLFGKTHDGDAEEMMAFNRWDEFYGFNNGGHEASPNNPLRGEKGTYWEGGLRVPFCLQWKGKLPARQASAKPLELRVRSGR